MLSDIDINLLYSLLRLEKAAKEDLFLKKINKKLKQKEINEVQIFPFKKKFRADFKRLNEEWLKKYFTVEDEDKRQFLNPEKEIINKGGELFFAILNGEVVGTCAMIKIDDSIFELAKMAVTEKAQGKQIGKKLMLTCIGFAVEKNAKKIILSTSPKLTSAINLYQSIGFKRTDKKNTPLVYKRKLFTMELGLTSD
jgi:N-acetylglutamate synthase-like GNAT family acetyltransferase